MTDFGQGFFSGCLCAGSVALFIAVLVFILWTTRDSHAD